MTWVELGEIIGNMDDVERNKEATVWDSYQGWFCRINSCTPYDATVPGEDLSCDICSDDHWD